MGDRRISRLHSGALVFIMISASAGTSRADDAAIAFGGNPKMLHGHPSIRMVSERVIIVAGTKTDAVDCRFVFKNEGPACNVRMGFPDEGDGSYLTAIEEGDMPHPYGCIQHFRSWIDGRRVATTTVENKNYENGPVSWHTKIVHFAAGQTRVVTDRYSVPWGLIHDPTIRITQYTMHTGSSWKGPIGSAVLSVTFRERRGPLKALPFTAIHDEEPERESEWPDKSPSAIY